MSKLTKKARKRSRARRGALPGFGEPGYDMIDPEPRHRMRPPGITRSTISMFVDLRNSK